MEVSDLKAVMKVLSRESPGVISGSVRVIDGAGMRGGFPGKGPKGVLPGRLCCDSRKVRPGDIFVAIRGVTMDGHDYIEKAVQSGAAAVVAQREAAAPNGVPLVLVDNSAVVLGELAQVQAGLPGEKLMCLAVTGTNGKTTVAYLVRAMMQAGGRGCGMIGTVEYDVGDSRPAPAGNTTPDALLIAEMMGRMVDNGLEGMVMECSSHGLDQERTAGIDFAAAAFTNLSGDHLDYHRTRESYLQAKSKLFAGLREDSTAVINIDDPAGDYMIESAPGWVWRYGIDKPVEICGGHLAADLSGCEFDLTILGETVRTRTRMPGLYNVSNCLAAAGLARAGGVSLEAIAEAIECFPGVPGRLERVEAGQDFTVLVDYAHTDDALEHVLRTLRELCKGRLIVMFGCGGQRDQSKRPRMAAVAERYGDYIVLTNDNPRLEDPQEILAQIRAGFSQAGLEKVVEIPDRREAIGQALARAGREDVVLLAGKGHEDYQLIGGQRRDFDDRIVAREVLEKEKL